VPLVLAAGEPGKDILDPIATVFIGGNGGGRSI
jgi:Cu/Ag efflux pump CusA